MKASTEDLDTLLNNPLDDGYGNVYWEWPVNSGRQIFRVFTVGEGEFVALGLWEPDVSVLDDPLYAEGTHLEGRDAAVALIKRYRVSRKDEHVTRIILAGLGIR